jgi:DNA polymerase-3 subunit gamma/tau
LSNSFSQDEFAVVWKEYLSSIEKTNIRLYSLLSDKSPIVKDSNVVEIGILQTQETVVENEREKVVDFLRTKLKNGTISLKIEIVKQETGPKKAFTATEKYQQMVEKNPALSEMRKKLGLDLD